MALAKWKNEPTVCICGPLLKIYIFSRCDWAECHRLDGYESIKQQLYTMLCFLFTSGYGGFEEISGFDWVKDGAS